MFPSRDINYWLSVIIFIAGLDLLGIAPANAGGDEPLAVQEVADGIYVHIGQHVALDDPAHHDIANIGFIIGARCVAVIDSGGSVATGRRLKQAIHRLSDKPICYVINIHVHFDHVLGNQSFVAEGAVFVGHTQLAKDIEQNRSFFLENFQANLGPNANEDFIIAPSLAVEHTLTLDLGGRSLQLMAHPVAHSYSDLTVYDQKTKTLWTGDLLFRERIPALTGSLRGWLQVLDILKAQDVAQFIPGHGAVAYTVDEAFSAQLHYLNSLLKEVRTAINRGDFLESVLETAGQSQASHWLLFEQQHRSNVLQAFKELEWE